MNTLEYHEKAFGNVGWCIPPYVTLGFVSRLAKQIHDNGDAFNQDRLERALSSIYAADHLAAMACERYPITEYIKDYKQIISESIAAHFLGLDHLAALGLMPVIEGAAKKIAQSMNIATNVSSLKLLKSLANECKNQAIKKNTGDVGEISSMMDSFGNFVETYLFVRSEQYPLEDNTNRHGTLHGAYCDIDYGRPINFYKCMTAVDFLCFVSGFSTGYMPCFSPNPSQQSQKLSESYLLCQIIRKKMLP